MHNSTYMHFFLCKPSYLTGEINNPQDSLLTVSLLKYTIEAICLNSPKRCNAAHQEALKDEIERLRQLYHQQQIKATGGPDIATAASMHAKQELLTCEGAAMR